jgi:hypothetical protein
VYEVCLRCIKATWETKWDGDERVKCCNCKIENSLCYLATAVDLPDAQPQEQAVLEFD